MGAFTYRPDCGGGARVTAARHLSGPVTPDHIDRIEARFRTDQRPALLQIWPDRGTKEQTLDAELAKRGYAIADPTLCMGAHVADFPAPTQKRGFPSTYITAAQVEIWQEAGIGPARLAIMARVTAPKISILGRLGEAPAGTAFVARSGAAAMVHALEVSPPMRRQGVAREIMSYAARWAGENGAQTLHVLVTRDNVDAQAFYSSLGMQVSGRYHYRRKILAQPTGETR